MDLLIFQAPILMVQASLDGILLGILFALIAYGMALQWGVMNIINIAQGELVIMGGYVAYFMYMMGIHPGFGIIISPIIMYFVGWGLYKLVINKVVDRDLFISILATFGISILTQQLMNFIFGSDVVVAQSNFGTTMFFDGMVTLPNAKIFAYPDPASRQRKTSAGGRTDLSILANAGFIVKAPNKHMPVRDRINSVNSMLCNGKGERQILIHPKYTIQTFRANCFVQKLLNVKIILVEKTLLMIVLFWIIII